MKDRMSLLVRNVIEPPAVLILELCLCSKINAISKHFRVRFLLQYIGNLKGGGKAREIAYRI